MRDAIRLLFLAALLVLAQPLAWAQEVLKPLCADKDKACAERALQGHAARKLATWAAARNVPVAQRVGPAPPLLVQYLQLDNIFNGFFERPRASKLDGAFLADVKAAMVELPPEVWRLVDGRFMGLYFVDALGGSGFSDYVVDADQKIVAGYVVLDASLLAPHTANGWATWKENTPFKWQSTYKLEARIEADAHNNRKNAIQYILLHELGHLASIARNVHPPWNVFPKDAPDPGQYPFFDLSWKVDRQANRYVSVFDTTTFAQRKDVVYYLGPRLAGEDMATVYEALQQTNFPSLYAAARPGDDFAEAFASFVHVVVMHKPWRITISRDGTVVKTFDACWEEPRCAVKRAILEQMLKRPG